MKRISNQAQAFPAPPRAQGQTARKVIEIGSIAALALLSGFAFKGPQREPVQAVKTDPPAVFATEASAAWLPNEERGTYILPIAPEITVTEPVIQTPAPEPEPEPEPILHSIDAVSLEPETQEAVWLVCKENPTLYSMVLAMGFYESGFDPEAVGDHGNSIGWMQVQPRWHQERIDRLGVTDLKDPVQNAMVAVDYIDWIAERLNPEHPEDAYGTHSLLMAYNQGWQGANESWSAGRYSTNYSRKVLDLAATYLTEMEGWQ